MASSLSFTSSALYPKFIHHDISPSSTSPLVISFVHSFRAYFPRRTKTSLHQRRNQGLEIKALTLDFSGSFFEGGFGGEEDSSTPVEPGITAVEEKEEPQCPPGLRQYETMAVLRPDMSEDERLALTQKYEELLVAGGGMYVEVFNRGVIPLAYGIKKKNRAGEKKLNIMVGEWMVTKPSRSDEVVEADQQLKTANQVRAHFDSIAPKRPIKPSRSETEDFGSDSNPPLDVNVDTDTQIPELDKLISLQSDSHVKFTSDNGTVEQDEFVETQYYKQLGSIDKQHHATGTGFIKMVKEGSEDGFDLQLPKGLNGGVGRETVFPCLRSNPATNDWIPSVDADQIVYVSSKPNRSES